MASEETKIDVPAFIDYDSSDELEVEKWTANNFETYWRSCLARKRRISAHPWSIKHKALAAKLIGEFELDDIKQMINYWTEYSKMEAAPVFELFYTNRYKVKEKITEKDYSDWEF